MALDHVTVTAPEELGADTVTWYRDVLGLPEVPKPEGTRPKGAWFDTGNAQVHVTIDEQNPPEVAHLCLVVDDFDELVARLRRSGCHVEQATPIPGRHRFYTRDPAGNRIEMTTFEESPARVVYEEPG